MIRRPLRPRAFRSTAAMPLGRDRPVTAVLLLVFLLTLGLLLVPTTGSRVAYAEEPEPTAESTDDPPPTDEPPTEEPCGPQGDVGGPLPSGSQTISGTVKDGGGAGLDGIQVRISLTGVGGMSVITGIGGSYEMPDLGDATYTVGFFDWSGVYRSGFADPVILDGSGATGVDIVLTDEVRAAISGTVRNHAGDPVAGIELRPEGSYFPLAGCGSSGVDGTYEAPDLRAGAYKIRVTDPSGTYPDGFYSSVGGFTAIQNAATNVQVDGTDVPDIDITFPQTYTMSGIVRDGALAQVEGINVNACMVGTFACRDGETDASGGFTIERLVAGDYQVGLYGGGVGYLNGYYAGPGQFSRDIGEAETVTVSGDHSGLDLLAVLAPSASGRVTDGSGNGLADINVSFEDVNTYEGGSSTTDADGDYLVPGLQPGTYAVRFSDERQPPVYPSVYLGAGETPVADQDGAEPVPVPETDLTGINVSLAPGETVEVTITRLNGTAVPYANVRVCTAEFSCVADGMTDESGVVTIPAILPGSYKVSAIREDDYDQADVRWYINGALATTSFADADPVDVTANATNSIAMTIPNPSPPPVVSVNVSANPTSLPEPGGNVTYTVFVTNQGSGEFTITSLDDDTFGSLAGDADCKVGTMLDAGSSCAFDFVSAVSGTSGNVQTNVVAVCVENDQANQACDQDDATVTITGPAGTTTPIGTDVDVPLGDGSGQTPVTLTFGSVTGAGTTTLTIPSEPPSVPTGFTFGDPPSYFDIETTATFAGSITVCASFDPADFDDPSGVRLLHFATPPGAWEDITVPPVDAVNGEVCGATTSLSPFVLVEKTPAFTGFQPPIANLPAVNRANAGEAIKVVFGLGGDFGLSVLANGSPASQQTDCTTGAAIGSVEATTSTDKKAVLRYDKKKALYTYNWKTNKDWDGTCRRLSLTFSNATSAEADFDFRPKPKPAKGP